MCGVRNAFSSSRTLASAGNGSVTNVSRPQPQSGRFLASSHSASSSMIASPRVDQHRPRRSTKPVARHSAAPPLKLRVASAQTAPPPPRGRRARCRSSATRSRVGDDAPTSVPRNRRSSMRRSAHARIVEAVPCRAKSGGIFVKCDLVTRLAQLVHDSHEQGQRAWPADSDNSRVGSSATASTGASPGRYRRA